MPTVTSAAFGGVLSFIYNRPTIVGLWAAGARRYRVLHRFGTTDPLVPMRRTWSNYWWSGATYVLEAFGPDGTDSYELKDPGRDYSTKDLLFQWSSTEEQQRLLQWHRTIDEGLRNLERMRTFPSPGR